MTRIIARHDQQAGAVIQILLRRRRVVDVRVGAALDEGRAQASWKLHARIIQADLFVENGAARLAGILLGGKGIELPVLGVKQDDGPRRVIHDLPDGPPTPAALLTQDQQQNEGLGRTR